VPQSIQSFQLSLTPIASQSYFVRTEDVASGVPLAEEQVTWPVEEWTRQTERCMVDPLLGILSSDAAQSPASSGLLQLGHQLYQALFTKSLRESWVAAQGIAYNRRAYVRLRLGMRDPQLLQLPWEVMHDGDRARLGTIFPVATGDRIMFSRYQTGGAPARALLEPERKDALLRILIVIALPEDRERLELTTEITHLKQELEAGEKSDRPRICLEILEQPAREQLIRVLEQGQYDVFHYAGHSDVGAFGGNLYLVNGRSGLSEPLSGQDLAGLLVNNRTRLVVLNSCRGAYSAGDDRDKTDGVNNLAAAMVARGVPAVLAMAERIPDDVALLLTQLFYRNLKQGYPIDLSLSRARQALMSAYSSNYLYWALPVLYLHPEFDGYLLGGDRVPPADVDVDDKGELLPDYSALPLYEPEAIAQDVPPELLDELANEDDAPVLSDLVRQLADRPVSSPGSTQLSDDRAIAPGEGSEPSEELERAATEPPGEINPASEPPVARPATATAAQPLGILGLTRKQDWWSWLVAGIAVLALAIGIGQWLGRPGTEPSSEVQPDELENGVEEEAIAPEDPASSPTSPTAEAITAFQSGQIEEGVNRVEDFLDGGNLTAAASALEAVPDDTDDPRLIFLRGRLVWQQAQQGASDSQVQTAIALWQQAVQAQPDDIRYVNALGFAYAEAGQWEAAMRVWLAGVGRQGDDPGMFMDDFDWLEMTGTPSVQGLEGNRDRLMTYAGIVLAMQTLTEEGDVVAPDQVQQEAIALRQAIMEQSPADFQLNSLENDWLWTPNLVQQWQQIGA
jgi:hypothetical protein